jgi:uncharacterized protein
MQEPSMALFPQSSDTDSAPIIAPRAQSPLTFFVLVYALSTPLWVIGAVTGSQLSPDLPVSSFIWACPVIAASLLMYREHGTAGVFALLWRSFDYSRIRAKVWYVPAVLLLPGIYAVTYGVMHLLGTPLPALHFSLLAALGWFVGFFIAAECEELGWSGYALDRLQARWTAFEASILLGVVWAGFHLVPLVQLHPLAGLDRLVEPRDGGVTGVARLALQQHRTERLRHRAVSRYGEPGSDRSRPRFWPDGVLL